ncbi:MAG: tRNA (N6-isopentenyl adenosine(37)-C2)-methylthiotransferase MiaB [Clostridiales bacterium]|nr:tRNA (N6-isopentenyl adenosine(37)-C2)-methylthiotransferase MiaB [Clostridiales bacterium]
MNKTTVSEEERLFQHQFTLKVQSILSARYDKRPLAFVHTYGCQGNVADSERIKGMLYEMSYDFTDDIGQADFVLYNTCAVREHAEDRVFGNVGALKPYKKDKPSMKIALCGCMMQQQHIRDKMYKSYPFVDLVFGTHAIYKFPQLMFEMLSGGKRVYFAPDDNGLIMEDVPVFRDKDSKAWLPIMYGCNNFCTYCIVPYVRGRERSREPERIINEAKELISQGYKDITLLGQNVNSYGKNTDFNIDFADLIKEINSLEGDFIIRFMTSHPKDCTKKLLDTMASCDKVAKHIHLPFQSGNDRILKQMNRHYTREKYLELINYAKKVMPDISITSDVIVGFPGETTEEFNDTLSLIKEVEFTSLFTFIYSKREGTPASLMDDPISKEEKSKRFKELCDLQEQIAAKRTAKMDGKTYRVLCEGISRNDSSLLSGRTDGNVIIEFKGDNSLIGKYVNVKVTQPLNWIVRGEFINVLNG